MRCLQAVLVMSAITLQGGNAVCANDHGDNSSAVFEDEVNMLQMSIKSTERKDAAMVPEGCVPYSLNACQSAALALGLSLGGGGSAFAGKHSTKGCYTYSSGTYQGRAFYGTGGSDAQMQETPVSPKERVAGYDCIEGCVPYSALACKDAALALGYSLGGAGSAFADKHSTKGCYTYVSGKYKGMAFYGIGGTLAEMQDKGIWTSASPKSRPYGYDCITTTTTTTTTIPRIQLPGRLPTFFMIGMGQCTGKDARVEHLGWANCSSTIGSCQTEKDCAMQCALDFMCGAFGYFDGHCWKYKKLLPVDASGVPVPDDKWGFPYSSRSYFPYDSTSDAYDFYSCWIKRDTGSCDAGMGRSFVAEAKFNPPASCKSASRKYYKRLTGLGEMSCVAACSTEAIIDAGARDGCVGIYWSFSGDRKANSTSCYFIEGSVIRTCEYSTTTPLDSLTKRMSVACAR